MTLQSMNTKLKITHILYFQDVNNLCQVFSLYVTPFLKMFFFSGVIKLSKVELWPWILVFKKTYNIIPQIVFFSMKFEGLNLFGKMLAWCVCVNVRKSRMMLKNKSVA